jgi:hypothetical protein
LNELGCAMMNDRTAELLEDRVGNGDRSRGH